ncbi:phage terminase large subunit [Lysinibacillus fusiformis]|uniref:phage terminase large subunit n=1 Tax=Lysinibacillus fusiformis TaxID=28031 RepID=UPI00188263F0|nr:phage terminase large subunit [Lysinibacillus fusiformis]MBD8521814.1 phage terminase large subunit [Lysinibacillus fusiformis]
MNAEQVEIELLDALIEERKYLSRQSFWEYCKTRAPDFYIDGRTHLEKICETLQSLYEGRLLNDDGVPYENMIMNIPPRHGKSRTLIHFCEWVLGDRQQNRIITASYNEDLATVFSRYTRDGISEEKVYPHEIVYSDIFPGVKVKKGDSSYRQWALEGQHFNYKGAGLGGSITGKGGNILIVDDPIKNAAEAQNENALDKQWQWFTDTFLSRQEQTDRSIKIVNMTRWSKKDICGRILDGKRASEWYVLMMPAMDEEGNMLCPELLNRKNFDALSDFMDEAILNANYYQQPLDLKGRLYKAFKTYDGDLPTFKSIQNYTDTADTGDDYLCSIVYGVTFDNEAYVLDVLYTKAPMEETEPDTAKMLYDNKVNHAYIESNGGGRGFARSVEKELMEKHNSNYTYIEPFHQSNNKIARILSNSTWVMNHIYFPINWKDKWPDYYKAMNEYQREGQNKNDDAPDATTGVAEFVGSGSPYDF